MLVVPRDGELAVLTAGPWAALTAGMMVVPWAAVRVFPWADKMAEPTDIQWAAMWAAAMAGPWGWLVDWWVGESAGLLVAKRVVPWALTSAVSRAVARVARWDTGYSHLAARHLPHAWACPRVVQWAAP